MDPELEKRIRELPVVVSLRDMTWNKTGAWSLLKPDFVAKPPPCQAGCPAHVPVREIMTNIRENDYDAAAKLFIAANPFPAITGRVCHHPCQQRCLRGAFDGALEIRAVERFLGEIAGGSGVVPAPRRAVTGRVAAAGSGPSGLSFAYYMRVYGYAVTVFEKHGKPGGLLRYGIPPYRLPDSVLDAEIGRLETMGVEFRTGVTVTGKFIKKELSGYDGVFLGIGADVSRNLGIPGGTPDRALSGLAFLADYERYRGAFAGKSVAVIGGGNTAMDAARVSLRLGAGVSILYRRTRNEMPAIREEIEGALAEGCAFEFLTAPAAIHDRAGRQELTCDRMRLGEPDESGRRRPETIPGSQFTRTFDFVISAIGEDPDFLDFTDVVAVEHNAITAGAAGETGAPAVYAGGDAAGHARSVADAIASGRRAAAALHSALEGKPVSGDAAMTSPLTGDNMNMHYFDPQEPARIEELSPQDRTGGFAEIISGISEREAAREAQRCMSCGACTFCDNCVIFCPDFAVVPSGDGYVVREEYCKGCGICIRECPRGVLQWKETGER